MSSEELTLLRKLLERLDDLEGKLEALREAHVEAQKRVESDLQTLTRSLETITEYTEAELRWKKRKRKAGIYT